MKGSAWFEVKPGTQHGEIILLEGYGLRTGGVTGDLKIIINVTIPKRITKEQRKLLESYKSKVDQKRVKPKKR